MTGFSKVRTVILTAAFALAAVAALLLGWLRWDAHRPRDDWFDARHGNIETVLAHESTVDGGRIAESVRLRSTSGLEVAFRAVRSSSVSGPKPLLLVLGGHRTGRDAVDLFGDVGARAIVGIDYPYSGPDKVKGVLPVATTIPLARAAVLDTVPAISLVLDWLQGQQWAVTTRIVIVGASLGVPFATLAAARDRRIGAVMLVHGAADTRLWLEHNIARRVDAEVLQYPLATVLYWLAYGPVFDTRNHVAAISPRPVVVVAAREDERTPPGQAELLFDLAREPKRLRYTEGRHIQPGRIEIVRELMRIADEEFGFLTERAR